MMKIIKVIRCNNNGALFVEYENGITFGTLQMSDNIREFIRYARTAYTDGGFNYYTK